MNKSKIGFFLACTALAACQGGPDIEYKYPEQINGKYYIPLEQEQAQSAGTIFDGDLTLSLGGREKAKSETVSAARLQPAVYAEKIPVASVSVPASSSADLFQAAVSVLSAYPLASASRADGLVVTEWYAAAEPGEQLKATAVVMPEGGSKNALKVIVFRRIQDASGAWTEKGHDAKVAQFLEHDILMKTQKLKKSAESAD